MKVCLYSGTGKPFKDGTILRRLGDAMLTRGIPVLWDDAAEEPDVYVFEAVWQKVRYPRKPVVMHPENLIGQGARERHECHQGAAYVFNSEWLRTLYRSTYQLPFDHSVLIPPAFDDRRCDGSRLLYFEWEHPVVCCSKWSKRPYKRLPLHVQTIQAVRFKFGKPEATLHVFGWEPIMPYCHTPPYYWRDMDLHGIRLYQRSFVRMVYPALLHGARLLLHVSAIDSGPQTVMEAIARGIPAVVTNNMGAAEWIREIGPQAGEVVEVDPVTTTYEQVQAIIDTRFEQPSWERVRHPLAYRRFFNLCSDVSQASTIARAVVRQLAREDEGYTPPRKFTMDGIVEAWTTLFRQVTGR